MQITNIINKIIKITNKDLNYTWEIQDLTQQDNNIEFMIQENNSDLNQGIQKKSLIFQLNNLTGQASINNISIPHLRFLNQNLSYIFPSSPTIISSENKFHEANYGGRQPHQFILLHSEKSGGLLIHIDDQSARQKTFRLKKQNNQITISIKYYNLQILPNENNEINKNFRINFYTFKHWRQGIQIYQQYFTQQNQELQLQYQQKQQQQQQQQVAKDNKDWFKNVFYFRASELYCSNSNTKKLQKNEKKYGFDANTKQFQLCQHLIEEQKIIGGIDFNHIFDWSLYYSTNDKKETRVGDYCPWDQDRYQYGLDQFNNEIEHIHKKLNIYTGLYIEGYMVDKNAKICNTIDFNKEQMLNDIGQPYKRWGPDSYYMCPYSKIVQNYLCNLYTRLQEETLSKGFYIDEFGFGQLTSHYKHCTNSEHLHHRQFDSGIGELEIIKKVRNILKNENALYIEQIPGDITIQFIDGSFSNSARIMAKQKFRIPLILTRFLFPNFKIFELVDDDEGLLYSQDHILAIKIQFWNGTGIYLASCIQKYSQQIQDLLKLNFFFIDKYRSCYISQNPVFLYQWDFTDETKDLILINMFPDLEKNIFVWNFINLTTNTLYQAFDLAFINSYLNNFDIKYYIIQYIETYNILFDLNSNKENTIQITLNCNSIGAIAIKFTCKAKQTLLNSQQQQQSLQSEIAELLVDKQKLEKDLQSYDGKIQEQEQKKYQTWNQIIDYEKTIKDLESEQKQLSIKKQDQDKQIAIQIQEINNPVQFEESKNQNSNHPNNQNKEIYEKIKDLLNTNQLYQELIKNEQQKKEKDELYKKLEKQKQDQETILKNLKNKQNQI